MKKIIFTITVMIAAMTCKAQITYEHSYLLCGTNSCNFGSVQLDAGLFNYLYMDRNTSSYVLYNLNHSINVSGIFPIPLTSYDVSAFYFSRSLFDCDTNNIEFLMTSGQPANGNPKFVRIYRTDGTLLLDIPEAQYGYTYGPAIFNSDQGTKLMVSYPFDSLQVYSLCGTLPSNDLTTDVNEVHKTSLHNIYPNPTADFITVEYELPPGVKTAEFFFCDMKGNLVKKFVVDHQFKNLQLTTGDLPSGEYLCYLKTSTGEISGKRFIKIK